MEASDFFGQLNERLDAETSKEEAEREEERQRELARREIEQRNHDRVIPLLQRYKDELERRGVAVTLYVNKGTGEFSHFILHCSDAAASIGIGITWGRFSEPGSSAFVETVYGTRNESDRKLDHDESLRHQTVSYDESFDIAEFEKFLQRVIEEFFHIAESYGGYRSSRH